MNDRIRRVEVRATEERVMAERYPVSLRLRYNVSQATTLHITREELRDIVSQAWALGVTRHGY